MAQPSWERQLVRRGRRRTEVDLAEAARRVARESHEAGHRQWTEAEKLARLLKQTAWNRVKY